MFDQTLIPCVPPPTTPHNKPHPQTPETKTNPNPQLALSGGAKVVLNPHPQATNASESTNLKMWPLLGKSNDTIRLVILNKHETDAALLTATLNRSHYGAAKLLRLTAPEGLSSTGGAVLGGVSYGEEGVEPLGTVEGEKIEWRLDGAGGSVYEVFMPPASAALLVLTP